MSFTDLVFLPFAILFFGAYWSGYNYRQVRLVTLAVFSSLFYAWWDWRFLFLLLASGLVDYFASRWMYEKPPWRKAALFLSLAMNLGALGVFKYSGFFAEVLEQVLRPLLGELPLKDSIPEFYLLLPVGISFYTFQSLSYTLDVYHGKLKPTRNFLHFYAYLALFPQLVAGPIVRARSLLPQLLERPQMDARRLWAGLKMVVGGFFFKTVLANNIAPLVNASYAGRGGGDDMLFWWQAAFAFGLQIYFDFAGYSLIARGLLRWMGLGVKANFRNPYQSRSFRDFWQRWHISLSTWFRDYVYIPLGGSRGSFLQTSLALWATFLLSGLWHGAAYTYLAWAVVHVLCLQVERSLGSKLRLPEVISWFLVLLTTTFAWNFFRAESLSQALAIAQEMLSLQLSTDFMRYGKLEKIFMLWGCLVIAWQAMLGHSPWFRKFATRPLVEVFLLFVQFACVLLIRGEEQSFVYFQF